MLPEGTNKQMACAYYRIDSDDYFGLLLNTAKTDSIGAIRILMDVKKQYQLQLINQMLQFQILLF